MAAVQARVGGAPQDEFNLSFNDIIARTPGQCGRGDAKKGMYTHRNGNILVVYTVNPQFVEIEARQNGRRTNRTGFTRTGMAIIDKKGNVRLVTANRDPDGQKNWKEFTGQITISGNPHVVPNPPQEANADGDDFVDEDDDN